MLLFHEGLPRSGKSYEAMVKHAMAALKKGRNVYARIDGLNYEKISVASEVPLEKVQELLVHLTEEDVKNIENYPFKVASLIILDEAQNYWPDVRKPLNEKLTKFVAEHGHEGHDILLMGQTFSDIHKLWKNRTSQKVVFVKLDMVGKGTSYQWTLYKATKPQKFVEVSKGTEKYDEKYFGTYKSFVEGAEGTQLYDDKRASIWNNPVFKKWLPIGVVVFGFAIYKLVQTFNGGLEQSITKKEPQAQTQTASKPVSGQAVAKVVDEPPPKKSAQDYIETISETHRIRVTAIIKSKKKTDAMFEWYDEALHVKERLSMLALARLGYRVELDEDMLMATISKGKLVYTATQFPIDSNLGKTSERTNDAIRGGYGNRSQITTAPEDGYGVLGGRREGVRTPALEAKPVT